MSNKKPALIIEEHLDLGAELEAMRSRMNTITVKLANSYPLKIGGDGMAGVPL